jgi:predicted DsbA family dithiol-disulfide isomerase
VGKRWLTLAAEQLGGAARFNLTISRRPFFLYPRGEHTLSRWGERVDALYSPHASADLVRLGQAAGFSFDMEAPLSDTHDSHRLVLWAQRERVGLGEELAQAIGHRYFERRQRLADRDMLADCAEEVGLSRAKAAAFLAGDEGHAEVRQAVEENRRAGITSIPLFRFRSGEYARAVHGSADVATFAEVLGEIDAHWAARVGGTSQDEACAAGDAQAS